MTLQHLSATTGIFLNSAPMSLANTGVVKEIIWSSESPHTPGHLKTPKHLHQIPEEFCSMRHESSREL